MQNLIILHSFASDNATLAGGSFVAGLPLANMKLQKLSLLAQTTDATLASTQFTVALPAAILLRALALPRTNLTAAAKYRIRIYNSNTFTTAIYDTGWLNLIADNDVERGQSLIHVFAVAQTGRWIRIELDDTANPAGFLRLPRLVIGPALQPTVNFVVGAGMRFLNNNTTSQNLLGGKKRWRKSSPRNWRINIDTLPDAEAFGSVYEFNRDTAFDGQVFIIPEPDLTDSRLQRTSFLATVETGEGINRNYVGLSGTGYEFTEEMNT